MTVSKRAFDLVVVLLLLLPLGLLIALTAIVVIILQGRPAFYLSERMRDVGRPFKLVKFRTMRFSASDAGVSGGDKADRITPIGRFLRRTRLDELPQIWNVLTGDMSLVGPRPPLREYVERFPDLYGRVLRSRPGITGLATSIYHEHEERILAGCLDAEETDRAYARRCIPTKAKIDLIYQRNQSVCFDMVVFFGTLFRVVGRGHR
jgi:lipopolysaccharide/colanic/teichoic acid biosynthesis glycosyltransferase